LSFLALALSITRIPPLSDSASDAHASQVNANERFVLFISSHPQPTFLSSCPQNANWAHSTFGNDRASTKF
jgi:hypothetical protein